jgi:hypothetical protein
MAERHGLDARARERASDLLPDRNIARPVLCTFQMTKVAVSREMFADILSLIARLRAPPAPARAEDRARPDGQRQQRCALVQANHQVSLPRHCQLAGSTTYCARNKRFIVA